MKTIFFLAVLIATCLPVLAQSPTLSNPNASKEATALYRYLYAINGKKILSGQMVVKWGVNELDYIQEVTGKQPAIRGIDYIDSKENDRETQYAIDWWKRGGIPTIMWHWGAPGIGEGYENSKKAVDIDRCFQEGTVEYTAFWAELKAKADQLQKLRDAHVPVLWRPFHELNGNWFWWGKQGPVQFKRLWITMYNYFVKERKLDNLVWVLCYTGDPSGDWYPGDPYVDIAGADTYDKNDAAHAPMFNKVKLAVPGKKLIAFHECGTPPDPEKCLAEDAMWSWWMEWHTDHLTTLDKEYLKKLYHDDLVITLDEVPDIVRQYAK